MSLVYKIVFLTIIAFTILFASWYVLQGEIYFPSDIARDFHLLLELDQKKIVLIGPRSSSGLFHGPLWLYVNYPLFLLGNGNPIILGWGWVLLSILFGISCYFIGKKLFDKPTGYLFTLLGFLYVAFHARGMFNPHGAMLLIPLFFFLFVRYCETLRFRYLAAHVLVTALIIQFQMAVGIPFLILSIAAVTYLAIKSNKKKHILTFAILVIPLSNFIIFDLRHDLILSQKVISFLSPVSEGKNYNYLGLIENRVNLALGGSEIIRQDKGLRNLVLFMLVLLLILIQVRNRKYKIVYLSFLYFYFGFFILSFINKGQILYFYQFPIFPLVLLIFSSFTTSKYKGLFLIVFTAVLMTNIQTAFEEINSSKNFIGKDVYSWKFLSNISGEAFKGSEKEFGYFVYSPDVVAYEAKYAMFYTEKTNIKSAFSFQKKPVTYLLIAPPPQNNPYMKDEWWRTNQLNIKSKPSSILKYDNGYKLEKYELIPEEIKIPFDPAINPGIHFR